MNAADVTASDVLTGVLAMIGSDSHEIPRDTTAILGALTAAGFAVVKLPEPEEPERGAVGIGWDEALPYSVTVWDSHRDQVQLSYLNEPDEPMRPEHARRLAAALLAAAEHSERAEQ